MNERAAPGKGASHAHAEHMDAIYGLQRHFYDLTRKYYLLGRDRLIDALDMAPGQSLLEIGCGTGRNLAAIGRRYRHARLFGLDISSEMLKSADATLKRRGLDGRTVLRKADATDFDAARLFGVGEFDRIVFSYTLSMIPGWERALDAGVGALARGGQIHIVDFGTGAGLPGWFRMALLRWLRRFSVTPRADLPQICEQLGRRHGLSCRIDAPYRGYAWRITLTR